MSQYIERESDGALTQVRKSVCYASGKKGVEKVHLSGIYLLHNAHATNEKVEAHSDEEDGELINNPMSFFAEKSWIKTYKAALVKHRTT